MESAAWRADGERITAGAGSEGSPIGNESELVGSGLIRGGPSKGNAIWGGFGAGASCCLGWPADETCRRSGDGELNPSEFDTGLTHPAGRSLTGTAGSEILGPTAFENVEMGGAGDTCGLDRKGSAGTCGRNADGVGIDEIRVVGFNPALSGGAAAVGSGAEGELVGSSIASRSALAWRMSAENLGGAAAGVFRDNSMIWVGIDLSSSCREIASVRETSGTENVGGAGIAIAPCSAGVARDSSCGRFSIEEYSGTPTTGAANTDGVDTGDEIPVCDASTCVSDVLRALSSP